MKVTKATMSIPANAVIRIGAMQFPVKSLETIDGVPTIKLDFENITIARSQGPGLPHGKRAKIKGNELIENPANDGIFVDDLLRLVDENPLSAPFITLCVQDIETHNSRIVGASRDDNTPSDGPGGVLWLKVQADEDTLTDAFAFTPGKDLPAAAQKEDTLLKRAIETILDLRAAASHFEDDDDLDAAKEKADDLLGDLAEAGYEVVIGPK